MPPRTPLPPVHRAGGAAPFPHAAAHPGEPGDVLKARPAAAVRHLVTDPEYADLRAAAPAWARSCDRRPPSCAYSPQIPLPGRRVTHPRDPAPPLAGRPGETGGGRRVCAWHVGVGGAAE
ncbi:hypothetical protein SNE510_62970 [Streptomyces sp. NE5-10]|nr:hypothetical protein SNE510_62970 [Streptomyces sp. NE5-10]